MLRYERQPLEPCGGEWRVFVPQHNGVCVWCYVYVRVWCQGQWLTYKNDYICMSQTLFGIHALTSIWKIHRIKTKFSDAIRTSPTRLPLWLCIIHPTCFLWLFCIRRRTWLVADGVYGRYMSVCKTKCQFGSTVIPQKGLELMCACTNNPKFNILSMLYADSFFTTATLQMRWSQVNHLLLYMFVFGAEWSDLS